MPLSSDPVKQAAQLANLRPGAGGGDGGHGRALKHGGSAVQATRRIAGAWAHAIVEQIEADAPLRNGDGSFPRADRLQAEVIGSACARLEAIEAWLAVRPAVTAKGKPWPVEDTARRLRGDVERGLDRLGMSTRSRAALGLDVVRGLDLAAAMSDGDEAALRAAGVIDGEAASDG